MERLVNDLIRIQLALLESWITATMHAWQGWQHVITANHDLLRHPAFHRWHNILPMGADWMDHYGRRAHDVDIEHLR